LPLRFKTNLDSGNLDLFDDGLTDVQQYRRDNRSYFKGLEYWRGSMSGSGMLISDKYELFPQTSYKYSNDYRFSYGETVTLYKLSSDAGGKGTWTNMPDVLLPKFAHGLQNSMLVTALALLLHF